MKNTIHLFISLIIGAYALYGLLVQDHSPTPGKMFPSWEDLIHTGIFALLFFTGLIIAVSHVPSVFGKNRKNISIVICLLSASIPISNVTRLLIGYSANSYHQYKDKKYHLWKSDREILALELIQFLKSHPESYTYIGKAETIKLRGFDEYLINTDIAHMVDRGAVVCPWGEEVTFALDRNKDGFIEFLNQKKAVRGVNPENKENLHYAVSVSLSHQVQTSFHENASFHHIAITE